MSTPYDFHKLLMVITNACNLKCKMCSVITPPRNVLPKEWAMEAADFAGRRGFQRAEITGGEPTLVPYFWELLDRMCAAVPTVEVTTNAYKLTDEQIERFCQYDNLWIQISIDGVDDVHDTIRRAPGGFDATVERIRKFIDGGAKVALHTVIQAENFRNMVETYEYFKDFPLRWHAFSLVEPTQYVETLIDPADLPEFERIMRDVKQRADRDGNDVVLSEEVIRNFSYRVKYPALVTHPGRNCTVVWRSVIIKTTGEVVPCWQYDWVGDPEVRRQLGERSLDAIVDDPKVIQQLNEAVGPGGCRGCRTTCFYWDDDFRRKSLNPAAALKARRAWLGAKEHLRIHQPAAFEAARAVKRLVRGQ